MIYRTEQSILNWYKPCFNDCSLHNCRLANSWKHNKDIFPTSNFVITSVIYIALCQGDYQIMRSYGRPEADFEFRNHFVIYQFSDVYHFEAFYECVHLYICLYLYMYIGSEWWYQSLDYCMIWQRLDIMKTFAGCAIFNDQMYFLDIMFQMHSRM